MRSGSRYRFARPLGNRVRETLVGITVARREDLAKELLVVLLVALKQS